MPSVNYMKKQCIQDFQIIFWNINSLQLVNMDISKIILLRLPYLIFLNEYNALNDKKVAVGVFFDYSKAFDCFDHNIFVGVKKTL